MKKLEYSVFVENYNKNDFSTCCLCFSHRQNLTIEEKNKIVEVEGLKYHEYCHQVSIINPLYRKLLKEAYDKYPESYFDDFSYTLFGEVSHICDDEGMIDYKIEINEEWMIIYSLYNEGASELKYPLKYDKFIQHEGMDFAFLNLIRSKFPNNVI